MEEFKDSPYKKIPDQLINLYTMNGKISVFDWLVHTRMRA